MQIILWASIFLIVYNYLLFPFCIVFFSTKKKLPFKILEKEQLPSVSILIAAFNEEEVISAKIDSILKSNYPLSKIEVLIGSDNSTDRTNVIVRAFEKEHPGIKLVEFTQRTGKPKIVDTLKEQAKHDFLILTDANVYFGEDLIVELLKYYADENVGLIGGNIINQNIKNSGISVQEDTYLNLENKVKFGEGYLFGKMLGAFGGVFSIRKELYKEVPKGFIVDDFYISMQVLLAGKKAILNNEAIAYEDISNNMRDEFNRKTRIATGNFQNMAYFFGKIAKSSFSLLFLFFSHKVIRWLTPFFLITTLISSLYLWNYSEINFYVCLLNLIFYALILVDFLLKQLNIHLVLLRGISHFVSMNVALLIGFTRFLTKPTSNIWSPTKRNQ